MTMATIIMSIVTTVTITTMTERVATGLSDHRRLARLMRLMAWLSPSFPVGAFSYSHGIEQAVEAGLIPDRDAAATWISGILHFGAGWIDAGLFLAAHRAVTSDDAAALPAVAGSAAAWRGTAETALEASAQGRAFLSTLQAAWSGPELDPWLAHLAARPSYPVVVAVAAAAIELPEDEALAAYLHAFAANLISAALRLVPLGQTDGQRLLARFSDEIPAIVVAARLTPPEDLGSAALMVDWTSARHETQYTRLFRS